MRIPSGDLAPARRGRRRGGYGRHRHPWVRPVAAAVVVVAVVAGAAYALTRGGAAHKVSARTPTPTAGPSASACPPHTPVPVLAGGRPAPAAVAVRVMNGTRRNGLGHTVGNGLTARGFQVTVAGNAPPPAAGTTAVSYGAGAGPAAEVVEAQLLGSAAVAAPALPAGAVEVVLGESFVRLRTPSEAALFLAGLPPAARPGPTPSPSCR